LNNTARGKTFTNSVTCFKLADDGKGHKVKKPTDVLVTTDDGLLYFVNYTSRQVDKIIQLHDDPIQSINAAPPKDDETIPFFLTASRSGNMRIWSPDFEKLVSELSLCQEISDCDINSEQKEIAVMSTDGNLSLLELESSSFKVLMRSHTDDIEDIAFNQIT
jgi:WD40 repeat protein